MTKKELLAIEFPRIVENRYEIRCQTVTDGLVLAFYHMHELVVRAWQGKEQFINIIEETKRETVKKLNDIYVVGGGLLNRYGSLLEYVVSEEDKNTLVQFYEEDDIQMILGNKIAALQDQIKSKKSKEKEAKKVACDTEKVKLVTRLPKGFDEWLSKRRVVMILGNKDKKTGERTVTCSYCKGTWNTKEEKGGMECPHCKSYGPLKKNRIRTKQFEYYSGIYLGKNKAGELIECVRNCTVIYNKNYYDRSVTFYEGDRRIIPGKKETESIYIRYGKDSYKESMRCFNRHCSFVYAYSSPGYIYPYNIKRLLKGTPYEYYEMEKYAKYLEHEHDTGFLKTFLYTVKKYPILEQVMKAGYRDSCYSFILYNQHSIVLNYIQRYLTCKLPSGVSLHTAMGLSKTQFTEIRKEKNVLRKNIEIAIAAKANETQPDTPMEVIQAYTSLFFLNDNVRHSYYDPPILPAFSKKEMLTVSFVRYMEKTPELYRRNFVKDYLDYKNWLDVLGYAPAKARLRPKDFKAEHDRIEREYQAYRDREKQELLKKESEYMGQIKPLLEELFKIPLSNNEYEIVIPSCREDLVNESEKLHHCVRTYTSRIYEHRCVIVFIRKKNALDVPFYTMEINKNMNIQQCRTLKNDSYELDSKINQMVMDYAAQIKKRSMMKEYHPILEQLKFVAA